MVLNGNAVSKKMHFYHLLKKKDLNLLKNNPIIGMFSLDFMVDLICQRYTIIILMDIPRH